MQRFRVTSATRVAFTMFSDTDSYEAGGRRAAGTDLAGQTAAQLARGGPDLRVSTGELTMWRTRPNLRSQLLCNAVASPTTPGTVRARPC